jgi:hypothetical protein
MMCALLALLMEKPCFDRRPEPVSAPYIIENDGGGQLLSVVDDREMLLRWGGAVQIRGTCASACVIFTTLPNACLAPDLKIGFHGSSVTLGPVGNPQMARHLRGGVRAQFEAEWQFIPPDRIHWIDTAAYARLDPQVRICEP